MTQMFEPVTKHIFRWGTNDAETGIMMYSHLLINGDKVVLIDPVAMPGLAQMIKVLAEPVAVIMTNYPHLRGSPILSRQLNVPLFIPDIETVDEDEKLVNTFLDLYSIRDATKYNELTDLPLGIKGHAIPGRHEMALKYGDFLVVGDSAYSLNGKLTFYPTGIWPDEGGIKTGATAAALTPLIKKTSADGLLSGHIGDIVSGLQKML